MCSSSQAWIKTYPTLAMVLELILKMSFSLNPPCRRLSQCAQAQRSLMPLWESPLKNLHAVGQKKKRARKHFSVKTEFCIFLMSFWKLRCIHWKKYWNFSSVLYLKFLLGWRSWKVELARCWQLQKTRPRTCLLAFVQFHSVCCC